MIIVIITTSVSIIMIITVIIIMIIIISSSNSSSTTLGAEGRCEECGGEVEEEGVERCRHTMLYYTIVHYNMI